MQKTKVLSWLFPENIRRVEKQADSYFGGGRYMLRKCQGENLRSDWPCHQSSAAWPCHGWNSSRWLPTQIHVHWVSDVIQPSHLLSSPSPAFSLPQHQGLFQWVSSSHQVAKVLEFQLQHAFQWIFRTDFLEDWLVWSPCSPRNSQESSPTPQFKSINFSVLSFLYGPADFSVAQMVKNLPAMQETWVWSLGREDYLEKGMATHSSILAWRIPWTEEPGELQSTGSQGVWHRDEHIPEPQ